MTYQTDKKRKRVAIKLEGVKVYGTQGGCKCGTQPTAAGGVNVVHS